jgi:rhamnose transport system permease protein
MPRGLERFKSWEGLLVVILLVTVIVNIVQSPVYLGVGNIINLFQLSIEKIILALVMTFIIINGEIDLSVASIMGMAACILGAMYEAGQPVVLGIIVALIAGALAGLLNGVMVAYVGLPSLAVTLAGLIGYRGIARILLEDRSVGNFPEWFDFIGQKPILGPLPLALIIFFILVVIAIVVLQYTAFGRYVYVIGNNREAARFAGVKVRRVKVSLFIVSGLVAAMCGLLFAARLGAVRGSMAEGFELDAITMVLLGGVSIFGGSGTLAGVFLSILIILNLRNGMSLNNVTGNVQTSVIGVLLILSVLIPNLAQNAQSVFKRRSVPATPTAVGVKKEDAKQTI